MWILIRRLIDAERGSLNCVCLSSFVGCFLPPPPSSSGHWYPSDSIRLVGFVHRKTKDHLFVCSKRSGDYCYYKRRGETHFMLFRHRLLGVTRKIGTPKFLGMINCPIMWSMYGGCPQNKHPHVRPNYPFIIRAVMLIANWIRKALGIGNREAKQASKRAKESQRSLNKILWKSAGNPLKF